MNYVTCYSCLYDSFIAEERQESENKTKEHLLIQMLMKNIDTNVIKPVWIHRIQNIVSVLVQKTKKHRKTKNLFSKTISTKCNLK